MGAALRFKTTSVPRQQGELARLKVVRGPDYGATYVVTAGRATVGRGEDNDIVISDLKSSRNHAEISLTANGWIVRDLGSANGILLNGKAARTGNLGSKDTISIGETILEFMTSDQATMMLVSPVRSVEQIQSEQAAFSAQKDRIRSLGMPGGGAYAAPGGKRADSKLILYGLLAVGAAFLFLTPDSKPPTPKKSTKKIEDKLPSGDLEKYLPGAVDDIPMVAKSADIFFKNGFREYRQRNWLRAKVQFETVLQMSPGHALARLYLLNCENQIEGEVKGHLKSGKESLDAGKLKESRGHFEAVLRLLYRDQTNPAYVEATSQLETVIKQMRMEVTR